MRLAYVFLPRFPVQRRVLERPSLSGTPLVLHADERGVQRVRIASGAALALGIHPGQTVAAAAALAPALGRERFDEAEERRALGALGEALLPLAPGFQVDGATGFWLDASAAPLSGGEAAWAQRVERALRHLGLVARCAVASERFTARAWACFGENGSAAGRRVAQARRDADPAPHAEVSWADGAEPAVPDGVGGALPGGGRVASAAEEAASGEAGAVHAVERDVSEEPPAPGAGGGARAVGGASSSAQEAPASGAVGAVRAADGEASGAGVEPSDSVLPPGGGAALSSLPLEALEAPGWLGPDAAGPFRALGLSTLGEVAALPAGALVARFGAAGHGVGRLCRGEDDSRFVPDALTEVLEEKVALDWPAEALEPVLFAVKMAADRLCARLQGRRRAAVRLTAFLWLDGTSLHAAEVREVPLLLARPSSQSRLLVELLRHRLTDVTVSQPIAALSVRVDEACDDPGRQLMLGDAPSGEAELEVVLARLQSALGAGALFSAEPRATHRPEASWAPTAFRPPDAGRLSELWGVVEAPTWTLGEPQAELTLDPPEAAPEAEAVEAVTAQPARDELALEGLVREAQARVSRRAPKAKGPPRPVVDEVALGARPPRLFRQPARLAMELSAEGALRAVRLLGRRRNVESAWGPERLSGHWWEASPFARDYYRVQIEGVGLLWIFRDGQDGQFYAQGVFD